MTEQFRQEIRDALRYERFLLVKAGLTLALLVLIVFVHWLAI